MARPSRRIRPPGRTAALVAAILPVALLAGTGSLPASDGSFRGYLETRYLSYFFDGRPDQGAWGRAHGEWEQPLGEQLLLRLWATLDGDWMGEGPEGVDPNTIYDDDEQDLRRALLRFDELSLTWRRERFDFAAGRLIIPWGRADGFNPTDNLSPFDSLDPLQPERLSTWATRGQLFLGRITLEGDALLPEPSRQPLLGTRWIPVPSRVDNPFHVPGSPATGPSTFPVSFENGELIYPSWSLENVAWAVKADYRGASWEGSLSHYDGWDDQPVFQADLPVPLSGRLPGPLPIDRIQPELRVTGADLAWVRGRFILRAEAALHRRGDPDENSFSFGIIEGEWSLGEWRFIAAWAEIWGEEATITTISRFEQGALPAAILRIGRDVATGTRISIQLLANLDGNGSLSQAEASWPLTPSLRLGAGVDVLEGPESTFIGLFRDNDRVWGRLRWSF